MDDDPGGTGGRGRTGRSANGPGEDAHRQPDEAEGARDRDEVPWSDSDERTDAADQTSAVRGEYVETIDSGRDNREAIVNDVVEHYESAAEEWAGVDPPERAFVRDQFFDFDYLDTAREISRQWVWRPFAYTSVLYDADSRTNFYHVSEPVLDDGEAYVRDDLETLLRDVLEWEQLEGGGPSTFKRAVREVVADYASAVPDGSLHKILYYLLRDFTGFKRIDPLMRDAGVEDISCDGHDIPVFVYHRQHRDLPTNVVFDEERLDTFIRWLAQRANRPISFSDPLVSATLPRGDRVQLLLGSDVGTRGSNFTVRRYQEIPFTPIDLIKRNTFSTMEIAYLWLCIEHQKSVVFVGPTASGKTTSMNAVSLFVRPYAKVVTIERTRELTIPHDNWVSTVTRERGRGANDVDVSVYDLLHAALHQRPEYIIVGEIRTEPEVLRTFLQSVFTGHAGYTTFHAHDVAETLGRFRSAPFSVEDQMIASVDIVSVQRQVFIDEERFRRNIRIAELTHTEDDGIGTIDAFSWDPATDTHRTQQVLSELPALQEIAEEHGWDDAGILEELDRRRDFLDYLVRADVTDYRDVWASIFAFSRDRGAVLDGVEEGTFDPSTIELNYYD